MSIRTEQFGKTIFGKEIKLFTIENKNGVSASVTNIGACLVKLIVPNKNGELKDVVLGFDSGEAYMTNSCFFGATVGRSANRIDGARFVIDGCEYLLDNSDNGNNLHSHADLGFHKQLWKEELLDNAVKFTYYEPDGTNGFPGNLDMSVTYTLTDDDALSIHYEGICDKKTLVNCTNHSYFNLAGHNSGDILNTLLKLNCSSYTPVASGSIPTGEIASVKGTVMDFTDFRVIGDDIDSDFDQLQLTGGYDHNFVVDDYDETLRLIAVAKCDGREMEVYTDMPGVQLYAGNFITPQEGKDGAEYGKRCGFCLETQYYPNSINQEGFVKPIVDAQEKYDKTTIYKFIR